LVHVPPAGENGVIELGDFVGKVTMDVVLPEADEWL
jgi:hypothetical protein